MKRIAQTIGLVIISAIQIVRRNRIAAGIVLALVFAPIIFFMLS